MMQRKTAMISVAAVTGGAHVVMVTIHSLPTCSVEPSAVSAVQEAAPASAPAPLPEPSSSDAFKWAKNWWPVQAADTVDASRPQAIQLLGESLCLWRDGEGNWQCFKDACPHRCAAIRRKC